MREVTHEKIKELVLDGSIWTAGFVEYYRMNPTYVRDAISPTLNLHVAPLTGEEREMAVKTLREEFLINSQICHSKSLGGVDVLRVEGTETNKLIALQKMATDDLWKETYAGYTQSKNLPVFGMSLEQRAYMKDLLLHWEIENQIKVSKALGSSEVLRVEGWDNITALAEKLPGIFPKHARSASPSNG